MAYQTAASTGHRVRRLDNLLSSIAVKTQVLEIVQKSLRKACLPSHYKHHTNIVDILGSLVVHLLHHLFNLIHRVGVREEGVRGCGDWHILNGSKCSLSLKLHVYRAEIPCIRLFPKARESSYIHRPVLIFDSSLTLFMRDHIWKMVRLVLSNRQWFPRSASKPQTLEKFMSQTESEQHPTSVWSLCCSLGMNLSVDRRRRRWRIYYRSVCSCPLLSRYCTKRRPTFSNTLSPNSARFSLTTPRQGVCLSAVADSRKFRKSRQNRAVVLLNTSTR